MSKMHVAILGSGNIGMDLMEKILRSPQLSLQAVIGIDETSEGLQLAQSKGVRTFHEGLEKFLAEDIQVDAIFDATSAYAHKIHAPLLKDHNIRAIDLTPAAIGPLTVPVVNLQTDEQVDNVNLVTCGGQATIPLIHAIAEVYDVTYAEIVATIASKSAGPATRSNIDEFIETTSRAIETVGGATVGKTVLILNPAEPPIMMNDTIHVEVNASVIDREKIDAVIERRVHEMQQFVPGYRLKAPTYIEGNRLSIFLEVTGAGDYLPAYAGNLDIITAAAVHIAEQWAVQKSYV